MTINDLNCKFYGWFDNLYNAAPKLPDKVFTLIADILKKQYLQEVEDYLDEQLIEYSMQRFERKFKVRAYIPRRGFFWRWNKTAKKLLKQYKADFEVFLAGLGKMTAEQKNCVEELKDLTRKVQQLPEAASTLPVPTESPAASTVPDVVSSSDNSTT